jgi:hypothetical protein
MEIVTWILVSLAYVVGLIWSLVWFLISGWVSTLLQIAVLIAIIYWLRYGWQRAPYEIWNRTRSFGRFFWSWIRGRDAERRTHDEAREIVRLVRRREVGDVNVSTLLSLAALGGLLLVAHL